MQAINHKCIQWDANAWPSERQATALPKRPLSDRKLTHQSEEFVVLEQLQEMREVTAHFLVHGAHHAHLMQGARPKRSTRVPTVHLLMEVTTVGSIYSWWYNKDKQQMAQLGANSKLYTFGASVHRIKNHSRGQQWKISAYVTNEEWDR